jgi:NAD(P)-dependent dehydrogenase (short-subunit alcohol dehydrogenase family)
MSGNALIVGAGSGLSAALARALSADGFRIALAARNTDKLKPLADELQAVTITADASEPTQVEALFTQLQSQFESLDVVVYNPSWRVGGPIAELDPEDVRKALMISAFGGFLVGKHAAGRMTAQGHGTILFTGATASVKGFAEWASFAMGKFALRGLAESMARELGPKNIHVAHFIIDGGIRDREQDRDQDQWLDPDAIAQTYLSVAKQDRSAWTFEVDLRPWAERF